MFKHVQGHGESIVEWNDVRRNQKLSDVKNDIVNEKKGDNYDIYLPIEGGKDDIRFRLVMNQIVSLLNYYLQQTEFEVKV